MTMCFPAGSPGLVRGVLQYLHARPELFAQPRATFLATFCDKVLSYSSGCIVPFTAASRHRVASLNT